MIKHAPSPVAAASTGREVEKSRRLRNRHTMPPRNMARQTGRPCFFRKLGIRFAVPIITDPARNAGSSLSEPAVSPASPAKESKSGPATQ